MLTATVGAVPIAHHSPALTRLSGRRRPVAAVVIPGDSVLETTAIGGTATFLSLYQNVIGTHTHFPPNSPFVDERAA